jgi:hypothetical protein
MVRNDPNKKVTVTLSLTGRQAAKLDLLAKTFNIKSREKALKHLLETFNMYR